MIEDYGRESGYGQIAPGKDISPYKEPKPNGRPKSNNVINSAIMGGMPLSGATFYGAQQTVGAPPLNAPAMPVDGIHRGPNANPNGYDGSGINPNAGAALTPSNVDTNGYAAPQYMPSNPGNVMPGWDQTKWNDAGHQSPKYGVGHILAEQSASPEHLQGLMAQIQQAYPGAQFNGKDKISLDGGKTWVDVIEKAGTNDPNQMKWAWMPDSAQGGQSAAQSPMQQAILGTLPMGTGGVDPGYAQRIREQVLQALMSQPGLSSLAAQYLK